MTPLIGKTPYQVLVTATLQPDETAGKDCYVDEQSPSTNYNNTLLAVGRDSYSCNCSQCCNTCPVTSPSCGCNSCFTTSCPLCGSTCNTCSVCSIPLCGWNACNCICVCGGCIPTSGCGCNPCGCGGGGCGCPAGKWSCKAQVCGQCCKTCSVQSCPSCGSSCNTCWVTDCSACGAQTCPICSTPACGSSPCNCSTCYYGRHMSFLEFDLTGIPADAYVSSAILTLRRNSGDSGHQADVHRVTSSWVETGPTYSSPPSFDASAAAVATVGATDTAWTITALVQAWVEKSLPNYGLEVRNNNFNLTGARTFFESSGSATPAIRPKLVVQYQRPHVGWGQPF